MNTTTAEQTRTSVWILGPLTVVRGGVEVPAGGQLQRRALAVLAASAGQVVTADTLAEAVWGDAAIERARGTLHVYLSNLRAVLGGKATIVARSPGYVLDPDLVDVDAAGFAADVDAGRAAAGDGDPAGAARHLRRGLARWRGEFLADLDDLDTLTEVATKLGELRLSALEECFDAELALGRHVELIAEIEPACLAHPLRERLWGQLMLALYRSGRQANALAAYQRARTVLVEELGIDPGPALRNLEQSILEQSGSLDQGDGASAGLVWFDENGRMRRLALEHLDTVSIGRAEGNRMRLDWDAKISRRHAQVSEQRGAWVLTDLGSANGTWRNGDRIAAEVPLLDGDLLRCGDTTIFVRLPSARSKADLGIEETLLAPKQ